MTDAEMRALRAAAEKATPGVWNTSGGNEVVTKGGRLLAICFGRESHTEPAALSNAAYIALANPAAVKELLDRVAAARREEREACAMLCESETDPTTAFWGRDDAARYALGKELAAAIRARKDTNDAG